MTPHTYHKPHIRELIRSFARVDEHFDGEISYLPDNVPHELYALNARLNVILSMSLRENICTKEYGERMLRVDDLKRIQQSIRAQSDNSENLREALRDKLYELLLRMDHCSEEQLCTRGIASLDAKPLSLFQVQQLVVFMIYETLAKLETSEELSAE